MVGIVQHLQRKERNKVAKPSGGLTKWFKQNWVDISAKKDGKHPKCGRRKGEKRGYPKCVPASVASRMSAAQKRSAVSRKRTAESKKRTGKRPSYAKTFA